MVATTLGAHRSNATPLHARVSTKYACASCIRGHRTSTCTHKDGSRGPLYPVRGKGRPPTQCETCRQKRKVSGRHIRCVCNINGSALADEIGDLDHTTTPPHSSEPRSKRQRISHTGVSGLSEKQPIASSEAESPVLSRSTPHAFDDAASSATLIEFPHDTTRRSSTTLSLSSLMNPCGCKSSRACACCRDRGKADANIANYPSAIPPDQTCDRTKCRCKDAFSSGTPLPPRLTLTGSSSLPGSVSTPPPTKGSGGCCSDPHKRQIREKRAAPSIELLLKAVDMSAEFEPPTCGCGDDCRCARCLNKANLRNDGDETDPEAVSKAGGSEKADELAPGCDDCAACDLSLERPSGIGAVDAWLDREKTTVTTETSPAISQSVTSRPQATPSQTTVAEPILHLHGGMLTPEATAVGDVARPGDDGVRAELVLLHPNCIACLHVVRNKGVGVLSSVSAPAQSQHTPAIPSRALT